MEKQQVFGGFKVQTVPTDYSFPQEDRPGKLPIPVCKTIPVVDLQKATRSSEKISIVQQIIEAGQEYGFFQVHFFSLILSISDLAICIFFSLHTFSGVKDTCTENPLIFVHRSIDAGN